MMYPQATPPRPKTNIGLIIGIAFLGMLAICGVSAVVATMNVKPTDPVVTVSPSSGVVTATPPRSVPPTSEPSPSSTVAPAGAVTSFADGTHEVGSGPGQIVPGTYTATTEQDSFKFCMWKRLSGFSGEGRDTIAWGTGGPKDSLRVTIAPTDKGFDPSGCGTWTKAG